MYDFTIGYSGIGPNDIPEQVYTIQSIFFFNHFPKGIHVHMRRFKINTIPNGTEEEFSHWVQQRWVEKDELLGHFYKHGKFPGEEDRTAQTPINLGNTSVLDLAQIWVFLLPYLFLMKTVIAFCYNLVA